MSLHDATEKGLDVIEYYTLTAIAILITIVDCFFLTLVVEKQLVATLLNVFTPLKQQK